MDLETAHKIIMGYLREQFGKVVELRDISVTRSSSGRVWVGNLCCVTKRGEVEVGRVGVSEAGHILSGFGVDQLVEALSRSKPFDSTTPPPDIDNPDPLAFEDDFSDMGLDSIEPPPEDGLTDVDEIDGFFSGIDNADLHEQIRGLLKSEAHEDLLEARHSMPQLLIDPEERGAVLRQMGELEIRLGETGLGLDYFEAAAREFADRADLDALTHLAETTLDVVGQEAFPTHPVSVLLDQTLARLNPIARLEQVPAFVELGDEEMFEIEGAAEDLNVSEGMDILVEGTLATRAYVVRTGIVAVRIETPDGGSRLVRCCFPGEFVGESRVLDGAEATCNATVTAQTPATFWSFNSERLSQLTRELPELKKRIEASRALHHLDSFFSMNKVTDTLDARIRDRLIGCISAIQYASKDEVLTTKGNIPKAVYLIIEGKIEYRLPGFPPRLYGADAFVGLSDVLHELPLEGDLVATDKCRLFRFDTNGLKKMAADAPPDVVAVLERLG